MGFQRYIMIINKGEIRGILFLLYHSYKLGIDLNEYTYDIANVR